MPWTCPACRQAIRRDEDERLPRTNRLYRCHVCRVDLIFDPNRQNFIVSEREPELPPQ